MYAELDTTAAASGAGRGESSVSKTLPSPSTLRRAAEFEFGPANTLCCKVGDGRFLIQYNGISRFNKPYHGRVGRADKSVLVSCFLVTWRLFFDPDESTPSSGGVRIVYRVDTEQH